MKKGIICFEFEGVIHPYSWGWECGELINVPPDPVIVGALLELSTEGWIIEILSHVAWSSDVVEQIEHYCRCYNIPYRHVTPVKPSSDIFVSTRAVCFDGDVTKLLKCLGLMADEKKES